MQSSSYIERRSRLTTYFDHTAAAAWKRLTTNSPVSRIRETVRAGRDEMRSQLLDWLPSDLRGRTLVDAGCGTGLLSIEAARRGATVVAIDVAASLVEAAIERMPDDLGAGSIEFRVGDMVADLPRAADYVVAMDSLIHYDAHDVLESVVAFADCARHKILFTSAPRTTLLAAMHFVGGFVPKREDRAPAIEPIRIDELRRDIDRRLSDDGWHSGRTYRVSRGFYISQAIEVTM